MSYEDEVVDILNQLNGESEIVVESNEDLFDKEILDSLQMVNMVSLIEEKFEIKIDVEDLIPENFSTVNGIVNYIKNRVSQVMNEEMRFV